MSDKDKKTSLGQGWTALIPSPSGYKGKAKPAFVPKIDLSQDTEPEQETDSSPKIEP